MDNLRRPRDGHGAAHPTNSPSSPSCTA